jgi:uncharacterized membrane protein
VTSPGGSDRWSDHEVEQFIGRLLQAGVVLSAVVALVGGAVYLYRYGATPAHYHTFRGVPDGLDSVKGVLAGTFALRSRWIIQFGLLLLIATPIARVALSLIAFAQQRDRTYVVITAIVLGVLLFSLFGS